MATTDGKYTLRLYYARSKHTSSPSGGERMFASKCFTGGAPDKLGVY
jgi:hypothetical protein